MQDEKDLLFQSMYERYNRVLRGIAYKHGVGNADIEDIVQETFITYYDKYPLEWNDKQKKAMLTRITINKCIDMHRKNKHFESFSLNDEEYIETPAINICGKEDSPLQKVLDEELAGTIRKCIDEIKGKQREVIEYYIIQQRPIEEVCDILNINISACRMHISRGRQHIRDYIDRENNKKPKK